MLSVLWRPWIFLGDDPVRLAFFDKTRPCPVAEECLKRSLVIVQSAVKHK